MKKILPLLVLLLLFFGPAPASAQSKLSDAAYAALPLAEMPQRDNAALLAKELAERRPGRANTFAVTSTTKIRPATHGEWTSEPSGELVWRLRLRSAGARTLNLGFSEFNLPAGARLFITGRDQEAIGPFTPADNEDHNQLWTPIVAGDELLLELYVPAEREHLVQLFLTAVNHDFEGINKTISGRCNIDVVCGAEDELAIIEQYRDIIRSVAAYTIGGTDVCTGFLVNNADEDGEPLFMTAAHCGVSPTRAPALTAYWNYENSSCREPNSNESGRRGDGSRATFNAGASHLATYRPSDVTLLRFDDPINPEANAFFAGWSAREEVPTDTMIAIHHPGVEEKRISFSFQDPYRAVYYGAPDPNADHLEIPDWDMGTTEGGSSGSPIFDRFKRVRGQLHGGNAACGNDEFDSYGYFATSWEGGGTPETRLKDWLDPCDSGVLVLDGLEQSRARASIVADANCFTSCAQGTTVIDLQLGDLLGTDVPVGIVSVPDVLTADLNRSAASGGETVILTVTGDENTPDGTYEVVVRAGSGSENDLITLQLDLVSPEPVNAPADLFPTDGTTNATSDVRFRWAFVDGATAYDFQLAGDPDFDFLLAEVPALTINSARPDVELEANTTYYWRVRSVDLCGVSEWTEAAAFSVGEVACLDPITTSTSVEISTGPGDIYELPLEVTEDVRIDRLVVRLGVRHSWVGDLRGELRGPNGQQIVLFDLNTTGSGCASDNLYLDLFESAPDSHTDLVSSCSTDQPGLYRSFQPRDDFSPFLGQSSLGTWTLVIIDNASRDGGAIEEFGLTFCSAGAATADYGFFSTDDQLTVCSDEPSQLTLRLGEDYPDNTLLLAEVNGTMLDNYTYSLDPNSRLVTVEFSAWGLVGEGFFDLTFTTDNPDGINRSLSLPLRVIGDTGLATPTTPDDGAFSGGRELVFAWTGADNTTGYRLQLATDEAFENQVYGSSTTATSERVLLDPGSYFWRVLSEGPCDTIASEVRSVQFTLTGVQNFADGRSVTIFPNPLQRQLNLRFGGDWNGELRATLFTAEGRQLRRFRAASPRGTLSYELEVLPAGIYYLRLESGGEQRTEKLVVLP